MLISLILFNPNSPLHLVNIGKAYYGGNKFLTGLSTGAGGTSPPNLLGGREFKAQICKTILISSISLLPFSVLFITEKLWIYYTSS